METVKSFKLKTLEMWSFSLLVILVSPSFGLYCHHGADHRHVGGTNKNIKLFRMDTSDFMANSEGKPAYFSAQIGTNPGKQPQQNAAAKGSVESSGGILSSCPTGCICQLVHNMVKVLCSGHFSQHFPVDMLRKDTTSLTICPADGQNDLSLGPSFKLLRQLKQLTIAYSGIPNIGQRTLWGLSGLRLLNLTGNKLEQLVEHNFDGLHSLRTLILDNNSIKSITSAAFHHLTQLEHLSLAQNQVRDLAPRIFFKLNALKVLNLSYNRLLIIDEEIFKDIRNLQVFRCNGCGLRTLKIGFSLRHLRSLSVANNEFSRISAIDPHILRSLHKFDIQDNRLQEIPVLESRRLEMLNVAHNKITAIADCAFCNTSLRHLDLAFNFIKNFSKRLFPKSMRTMKKLRLTGNPTPEKDITAVLNEMPGIEDLDLAGTGVISIPFSMFKANQEIKRLNLSSNYLVTIDPSILDYLVNLEHLDLSANFFMGLDQQFFNSVSAKSRLAMVYLQDNPWICDKCHVKPMVEWLQNSLMYWGACFSPNSPLCLRCSQPSSLYLTPLLELEVEHLPDCERDFPGYRSMTAAVSALSQYIAIAVLSGVLFIIGIIALARYRHYGVYHTHEEETFLEDEVLSNPVTVLDRNSESYVNLKYPSLCQPEE